MGLGSLTGAVVLDRRQGDEMLDLCDEFAPPRRTYPLAELPVIEPWTVETQILDEAGALRNVESCQSGLETPDCQVVWESGTNALHLRGDPLLPGETLKVRYASRRDWSPSR